ncbi:POTRA domain-containing protein [Pseudomonas aeruginosa]|uniref:POTRA domain-containing protein n=1 Tax=Pseudomonas aeruginosa TaxID=287 RepID=UPI001EE8A92F|nr:POTRA domain-containing protein [Pseudomonas aeruginosa]
MVLLPLLASAAPFTSPGDRDLIRDRQQRLLDEQRKRWRNSSNCPGGAPAAADASGDDERCFEIRRIELEGAGHLGESARRQLLAPYQGRCLGVGQLNALLKAVTDHYLDRGYVTTRAYLPQQDLASGTLRSSSSKAAGGPGQLRAGQPAANWR